MKLRNSLPVKSRPKIKITHGQSIKQSANYQSADCSYSVEVIVDDTPKAIKKGMKRAESLVEAALALKVTQQRKFLLQITEENNEAANQAKARRSRF